MASGVQIAGLEEGGAKKKPVYDNKKKKKNTKTSAEQDAEDAAKAAEDKKAEEERLAAENAEKEEEARKKKEEEGEPLPVFLLLKYILTLYQLPPQRQRRLLSRPKPLMMRAMSRSHGWMIQSKRKMKRTKLSLQRIKHPTSLN